jgi:hypothetical protein
MKIFKKVDGLSQTNYTVNFNEAFIVATNSDNELTINRVSGNANLVNDKTIIGKCKLTDKTKF